MRGGPGAEAGRRGRLGRLGFAALFAMLFVGACNDAIVPPPPKKSNQVPETNLFVQSGAGDSLQPQLYRITLHWLGSDPDGSVVKYRYRWVCRGGGSSCQADSAWAETGGTAGTFVMPAPQGTAHYLFQVASVDDDGAVDPSPSQQLFTLYDSRPVVTFQTGTLPTESLPGISFYLKAADPDTTADQGDHDSGAGLTEFRAWLDGQPVSRAKHAPVSQGYITFFREDFEGRYGQRTVKVQVLDDGLAVSDSIQHTWLVDTLPENGVLLVDDCWMGGFLATRSDSSYHRVLNRSLAAGGYITLDIHATSRLSRGDMEAQLALFDRVVWYTDADTLSSGALQLGRQGLLDLLQVRHGKLFLSSGLAFGTASAFGDQEVAFQQLFGISKLELAPNGSTNFSISRSDSVTVHPELGLGHFHFLSIGLRDIMECFESQNDASTKSLYFYPASTFVREGFVNPVQFDIGVYHESSGGARTVYVSFPIGLPVNSNVGENEDQIAKLLGQAGIIVAR